MKHFQTYPKDLTGLRFGRLTVIGLDHSDGRKTYWKCRCDCGEIVITTRNKLTSGRKYQCNKHNRLNLIGQKFGHLTVIEDLGMIQVNNCRHHLWRCKCDCGNYKDARSEYLYAKAGHIPSCGCADRRMLEHHSAEECKYRKARKRIYKIHYCMIDRCYKENTTRYVDYGGRGIYVCDEWYTPENLRIGYENFFRWSLSNGYKPGLTIDRIDNDMPYAPWNCRWVTLKDQANNRRNTRFIVYPNGNALPLSKFAEIYNTSVNAIGDKLSNNWSVDAIVYSLENPELHIWKSRCGGYKDCDMFTVLIPRRGYKIKYRRDLNEIT